MDEVIFKSRIDPRLAIVIVVAAVIALVAAVVSVVGRAAGGPAIAVMLTLVGAVLPLWILTSTRYVLSREQLRIVSGPFRWRVPLSEIRAIVPTRSPWSSPALSLERLRIDYGARWIIVSPRDAAAFIAELRRRRPSL